MGVFLKEMQNQTAAKSNPVKKSDVRQVKPHLLHIYASFLASAPPPRPPWRHVGARARCSLMMSFQCVPRILFTTRNLTMAKNWVPNVRWGCFRLSFLPNTKNNQIKIYDTWSIPQKIIRRRRYRVLYIWHEVSEERPSASFGYTSVVINICSCQSCVEQSFTKHRRFVDDQKMSTTLRTLFIRKTPFISDPFLVHTCRRGGRGICLKMGNIKQLRSDTDSWHLRGRQDWLDGTPWQPSGGGGLATACLPVPQKIVNPWKKQRFGQSSIIPV